MPSPRYLALLGANKSEVPALQVSTGASDADKIVATGADGRLDRSMLPDDPGVLLPASENIAAGALINIWNDAGTAKIRNADASGGVAKQAHGYAPDPITSGATGLAVLGDEVITGLSSITPGASYYLSGTTPGAFSTTPPSTGGHIRQFVGVGITASELNFKAGDEPIIRA